MWREYYKAMVSEPKWVDFAKEINELGMNPVLSFKNYLDFKEINIELTESDKRQIEKEFQKLFQELKEVKVEK